MQRTFRIINIILIALILSAILLFTRDIIGSVFSKKWLKAGKTGENSTTPSIPKTKNIMGYAGILEKNPFGNPMKLTPLSIEQGDKSAVPAHGENLILVGTAAGPKNLSYAIFEETSQSAPFNKQEVFAYGKNVYNYGILTKIEKGWVELRRGANVYTIPLTDIRVTEVEGKKHGTFARKVSEKEYVLDQKKVQGALNIFLIRERFKRHSIPLSKYSQTQGFYPICMTAGRKDSRFLK
ncbi:MAG: hypothetical protein HZC11_05765 [Nitrospirae bacterium]|nr:hypothetical protein [Nitrospirota bacterium]